jgi:poly(3-hydroxybutyrate) depolymerase
MSVTCVPSSGTFPASTVSTPVGYTQKATPAARLWQPGLQHRDNWLRRNGCPVTPVTERDVVVEASVYRPCNAGVEVVWRVYPAGHLLPKGADKTDMTTRMWDFFLRNPLPAGAAR